jgi:hypothetical protein
MKNDDIILRARIDDAFIKLKHIDEDITVMMKDEKTAANDMKHIRDRVYKLGSVLRLVIPAMEPSIEALTPVYKGGECYDEEVMTDDIERVEVFIEILQDTYDTIAIIEETSEKIDAIYKKADKLTGGLN